MLVFRGDAGVGGDAGVWTGCWCLGVMLVFGGEAGIQG